MRAIQVTIRLEPDVLARVDAAARAEEAAADKITRVGGAKVSRARIIGHLLEVGLSAYASEAERVAAQNEAMG